MKTVVPQWRIDELQLARYMEGSMSVRDIEMMPCKDFYDAQEFMRAQMYADGLYD